MQGSRPAKSISSAGRSTYPDSENFLDGPGGPIDKWALGSVSNLVMNEMVTQEILQDCGVFL